MPSTAPNTQIITDSSRTICFTSRRASPIARSIPISRVRSKTDMASVLTTPTTAMTRAMPSSPYVMFRMSPIDPLRSARRTDWSFTFTSGLLPSAERILSSSPPALPGSALIRIRSLARVCWSTWLAIVASEASALGATSLSV